MYCYQMRVSNNGIHVQGVSRVHYAHSWGTFVREVQSAFSKHECIRKDLTYWTDRDGEPLLEFQGFVMLHASNASIHKRKTKEFRRDVL